MSTGPGRLERIIELLRSRDDVEGAAELEIAAEVQREIDQIRRTTAEALEVLGGPRTPCTSLKLTQVSAGSRVRDVSSLNVRAMSGASARARAAGRPWSASVSAHDGCLAHEPMIASTSHAM